MDNYEKWNILQVNAYVMIQQNQEENRLRKKEKKKQSNHTPTHTYTHNVSCTVQGLDTKMHKIWTCPFTH